MEQMSKFGPITPTSSRDPSERRRPGRPRKVERAPAPEELVRHACELARREDAQARDDVLRACGPRRAETVEVFEQLVLEAARECAALAWQRREAEKRGRDIQRIASRRIGALMALATLIRLLHIARNGEPSAEQMRRVVGLLLEEVENAAYEVLPSATADTFVARLRESLAYIPPELL